MTLQSVQRVGRMGHQGRDHMHHARRQQVFFTADRHFQLSLHEIGDLLVHMAVFRQGNYPF